MITPIPTNELAGTDRIGGSRRDPVTVDLAVIGGSAAGLFCARTAGQRGRRVLVLDHQERLGSKILISGGGRCNFTNLGASADCYQTSGSPHFPRSALARFRPEDFLALVQAHGIAWHEKKAGQLFCNRSAREILGLLIEECSRVAVSIWKGCRVLTLVRLAEGDSQTPPPHPDVSIRSPAHPRWRLQTSQGPVEARSMVIATGGLSWPKLGASPFGYEVARQFGLEVVEPRPGLVPLTWGPADRAHYADLSGLSLDCEVTLGATSPCFGESLLFTHRGLSGPAILQISNYWRPGGRLRVNLLPGQHAADLLTAGLTGGRDAKAALRGHLPERFLRRWCELHAPAGPLAQCSRAQRESLVRQLHGWEIVPAGDEGFPKAEVTVGGVATRELSSKTLECVRVPGLHFVGEVVDVTGWLGGYNFQWAWASGFAAGSAA